MHVMFRLHVDLFAGLPGKLFLGFMGLLLVAIVTGVVLYAPFMRKLAFGEVRRDRSTRVKWLDLHNLLGIVTLVWAFVVGGTGMINTWPTCSSNTGRYDQLSLLLKMPYEGQPIVPAAERGPLQRAGGGAGPGAGRKLSFIAFPGTAFSSPHHNTFFLRGNEPLTSKTAQAGAGGCAHGAGHRRAPLPWYLTALLVSQPLHFWRLRRHADEDPLGAAGHRHHRGAGQWAVPVAAQGVQAASPSAHAADKSAGVFAGGALPASGAARSTEGAA